MPCEWLTEFRDEYAQLRARRADIAHEYRDFARDLVHYCDGATTRPRFRPKDLATSIPPLEHIYGTASIKPPVQRQLASIVHHEGWLACVSANRSQDAHSAELGTGVLRF